MNRLRFYLIKEEYVQYLSQFDPNVKYNKNESRIYIGIVLLINEMVYFAPLGSPKPKHLTMKNAIDFVKIGGGKLGVINLNNMIPVMESELIPFDISEVANLKYRNLLYDQLTEIRVMQDDIQFKANKLYHKVTNYSSFLNSRCVNYAIIETKAIEYQLNMIETYEVAVTQDDEEDLEQ